MKRLGLISLMMILFTSCTALPAPVSTPGTTVTTSPAIVPPSMTDRLLPLAVYSEPRVHEVSHIVIHSMSLVTIAPEDPFNIQNIWQLFYDTEVSAHFVIDREGVIHRFVDDGRKAHHAGKGTWAGDDRYTDSLNAYSVGIELLGIGTAEEMQQYITGEQYAALDPQWIGYTDAQYAALNELVDFLCARYPAIRRDRQHILAHSEYSPAKTDPGSLFDWGRLVLASSTTKPAD